VDVHAHLRYPGQPDKETIASGTAAAVQGGFTTVCAMANASPPVDSPERVEQVLAMAEAEARCRLHTMGAVSRDLQGQEGTDARELALSGATALSDDGNPVADEGLMRQALQASERLGIPVSAHEEVRGLAPATPDACWKCPGESQMVGRDLQLLGRDGGKLHVAHVSCTESVELIAEAQAAGLAVTAEATPHHLTMTSRVRDGGNNLPPGHGNSKVNPPLRSDADVTAVREGVRSGVISAIATDHAPHSSADKSGGLDGAAFGFSGFELALPLVMDLVRQGLLSLPAAVERLTLGPARCLGLAGGTLGAGAAADICVFDPAATWEPGRDTLVSKGKNHPAAGATVTGRVVMTVVGGTIYRFGADHGLRGFRAT
jgi:dihydroorotase